MTYDSLIATYDAKIARYRAALDAGTDPVLVTSRIAETRSERDKALESIEQAETEHEPINSLGVDEIAAILDQLGDLVKALRQEEPGQIQEVYRTLGLQLTYKHDEQTVHATIDLGRHRWDLVRVEGPTQTISPPPAILAAELYWTDSGVMSWTAARRG